MSKDSLSRDDMKPQSQTHCYDALPANVQTLLRKAATKGKVECGIETLACIDNDWLMVPTKKGLVQVAVGAGILYRI
jgi:hypothetical protein